MARRPYPRKNDKDRRVVVSFSLSDERLKWFMEYLAMEVGHEPSIEEVREYARQIAQSSIDEQVKRKIEFNDVMIM